MGCNGSKEAAAKKPANKPAAPANKAAPAAKKEVAKAAPKAEEKAVPNPEEKKTEEKVEEKKEEKVEEKVEEKKEEKPEEKAEEKTEEKAEEKTEEKAEDPVVTEEKPEEKAEEKVEEKTEEKAEEKTEEKVEEPVVTEEKVEEKEEVKAEEPVVAEGPKKKVLIVLTSQSEFPGVDDKKTGFWAEEFAAPYYVFVDAGMEVTLASPAGGEPPVDPASKTADFETAATKRFDADEAAKEQLATTKKLSEVNAADFDAVFYPGGHGPVFDLNSNTDSITLIENFIKANKPVGAVCHGPAVLLKAKTESGESILKDKAVTGFSNTEEEAVGLAKAVPYSLEDELNTLSGKYQKGENDWHPHVVADGLIITGQNPNSSEGTAQKVVEAL